MTREQFEFVRLIGNERRVGPSLASVSRHWQQQRETFLLSARMTTTLSSAGDL